MTSCPLMRPGPMDSGRTDRPTHRFFLVRKTREGLVTEGSPTVLLGEATEGALPPGSARWSWDGQELSAQVDGLGVFPLFYRQLADGVVVSDRIQLLLDRSGPATPDWDALALFLRTGFFVFEDTPFQAIRSFPAGGTLTWSALGGALRMEATPLPEPEVWTGTFDQAVSAFIDLVRMAVRRTVGGERPVVVPLSGGADSRHLLLALHHAGCRPAAVATVSRAYHADFDLEPAAELAARLGYPHTVLRPGDWLADEATKNLEVSFSTKWHSWLMPLRRFLASRPCLSVDGIGGDTFLKRSESRRKAHDGMAGGDPVAAARYMLREEQRWSPERMLQRLLRPEIFDRVPVEAAETRLAAAIQPHLAAPNPFGSYFFAHRTRRDIAASPIALLGAMAPQAAPFLDPSLLAFLRSLPFAFTASADLRREAIRRAYPKAADVPYAYDGPGQPADRGYQARAARRLAGHLLREGCPVWTRRAFLMPRLARTMVSASYARSTGWPLEPLLYLHQLNQLTR